MAKGVLTLLPTPSPPVPPLQEHSTEHRSVWEAAGTDGTVTGVTGSWDAVAERTSPYPRAVVGDRIRCIQVNEEKQNEREKQ